MSETLEYQAKDLNFRGYLARPKQAKRNPAILIFHDWTGCNDFAKKKANDIAELGYTAFAVDMYGEGKLGDSKEEKSALMTPLMEDRHSLLERATAAYAYLLKLDYIDTSKIAAIGFCFGGLCALDLARSGVDMKGVVSFHGLLSAPTFNEKQKITAKILALHGYDDPMVQMAQVQQFTHEMTEKKADWQLHMYSNTMHAFTNPNANDPNFGTVYNKHADERSWLTMKNFFAEIFN